MSEKNISSLGKRKLIDTQSFTVVAMLKSLRGAQKNLNGAFQEQEHANVVEKNSIDGNNEPPTSAQKVLPKGERFLIGCNQNCSCGVESLVSLVNFCAPDSRATGAMFELVSRQCPSPRDCFRRLFLPAIKCGDGDTVVRLLHCKLVDPAAENNRAIRVALDSEQFLIAKWLLASASVCVAASDDDLEEWCDRTCENTRRGLWRGPPIINPLTRAFQSAAAQNCVVHIDALLADGRVNPLPHVDKIFCTAAETQDWRVFDRLVCDKRVINHLHRICAHDLNRIGMLRTLFARACIGLQDLDLPALVTLEVLDALVPNSIKMHDKWRLITSIKHFNDSK